MMKIGLKSDSDYGLSRKEHFEELKKRAKGKLIINCKFEVRSGRSHPSYGTIIVSVTGDEFAWSGDD